MKTATLILAAVLTGSISAGQTIQLGTVGSTYPIAEKDAVSEILEKAKSIDWNKEFSQSKLEQKAKNFKPKDLVSLPAARENKSYAVDMTYTLEFDIPRVNERGEIIGVLYPKGYTFNPLDYVSYPITLIFLDATDEAQLTWLKDSPYLKDLRVKLLITDGNWHDLSKELNTRVFYANKQIIERFQLNALPSIVYQEGKLMRVQEINAHDYVHKKNRRN
ncbi:MAG TPA: hypothetical protein PLN83_01865 [Syntrophorhabdus sp.]|nr:hypothetical protein [Syntrophorhabdus sp.]